MTLQTENKKMVVESENNVLASNVFGRPNTRKKVLFIRAKKLRK